MTILNSSIYTLRKPGSWLPQLPCYPCPWSIIKCQAVTPTATTYFRHTSQSSLPALDLMSLLSSLNRDLSLAFLRHPRSYQKTLSREIWNLITRKKMLPSYKRNTQQRRKANPFSKTKFTSKHVHKLESCNECLRYEILYRKPLPSRGKMPVLRRASSGTKFTSGCSTDKNF